MSNVTTAPAPDAILELGLGFWASKTLLTAVELGVFTLLADGPLDREDLRSKLGLHERSARDFFDALVALGMLSRDGDRYGNAPETDFFLDRNKRSYVGGFLEMANARLFPSWSNLEDALRTGRPQNEASGGADLFDELYNDPDRLRKFLEAMSGATALIGGALAERFPWADVGSFIDVGCAKGALGVRLARAHPHLTGGGFDLPAVGPIFDEHAREVGLQDRLRFHAGNFFHDGLPSADVLIMGHVLHDWDLDTKKLLIAKAYDALDDGGFLVVYDAMIDDERRANRFALLLSLNMLIETPGGFEYSASDCRNWMTEAGFRSVQAAPLVGPDTFVVATK